MMGLIMSVPVFAQQTTVEGSRFFDNTYVGVNVGGQVGMTNFTGHNNWVVKPTGHVYVGKYLTPVFGLELNGDVYFHDGFSSRNTFVDATYVGIHGRVNLNNVFHKYKGYSDRVEFVPFAGLGWLHGYGTGFMEEEQYQPTQQRIADNSLATKMGVDVVFNLGETRAWTLNVRPTVMYALTGGHVSNTFPKYDAKNARVGVEVGFTYKFGHKNSKGDKVHNFTKAYTVKEYDDMVAQLSSQKPDTVVVTNEVVRQEVKNVEVYKFTSPHFECGKTQIDYTGEITLDQLAEQIKSSGKTYTITGYASMEGTEKFNNELSLNRAKVVYEGLVQRGVDPLKLKVVSGGPTDKFGQKYELNRTVTVKED